MRRLAVLIVACVAVGLGSAARAATFHVNSLADAIDAAPGDGFCATVHGVCTLRAAIQEANALPGSDIVVLPAGQITLDIAGRHEDAAATGDLDVTDDLTVTGAGQNSSLVATYHVDRVFEVHAPAHVTLSDLTILDGDLSVGETGGGVLNHGTLTLTRVTLRDNHAGVLISDDDGASGGGIANDGTATLTDVLLTANAAGDGRECSSGGWGGAVYNSGNLTMTNVTVAANRAGEGSPLPTDLACDVADASGGNGGGLYNSGTAMLDRVIFNANRAGNGSTSQVEGNFGDGGSGGGVFNLGTIVLTDVSFIGNVSGQAGQGPDEADVGGAGGGMSNSGDATLTNVTFDSNHAGPGAGNGGGDGGALANDGTATLTNVTITRNHAGDNLGPDAFGGNGGGLANDGTVVLLNVTVANNQAGIGAYQGMPGSGDQVAGTVELTNTIVSGAGTNCVGTVVSHGHNIDSGTTCGLAGPGDLSATAPLLDVLKSNGGFTQTMALLAGSPAIDAADGAACPATDQRGIVRPQGAGCDVGAYERAVGSGTVTPVPSLPTVTITASSTAVFPSSTPTPTASASTTPACAATGTPYCSDECSPCPTVRAGCASMTCGLCVQNPQCGQGETCVHHNGSIAGCCACATFTPVPSATPTSSPRATANVPGDADCDQRVTAADLPALLQLLPIGAVGSCNHADANNDGRVDGADLPIIIDAIFNTR